MHNEVIKQEKMNIRLCKYTIDWLVKNTEVKVFKPDTFEGYQRKIDDKHARRIVKYLLDSEFYLPTSIICSTDNNGELTSDTKLSIVDGQHRVEAFKIIKSENSEKYEKIKDFEISVIVLICPKEEDEIDTFITINKTSKKVDTSLAYVLRNMKNKNHNSSDELDVSQREYMAVEIAKILNENPKYKLWYEKIRYEGPTKNTFELITLNSFVKSLRAYLGILEKNSLVSCSWKNMNNENEFASKAELIADLLESTWEIVYKKWSEIDKTDIDDRRIIQGPIGFTTINRYMIRILRDNNYHFNDIEEYKMFVKDAINKIKIEGERWKQGEMYSKFTSESGYKAIVDDMLRGSKFINNSK